MDIRAAALIWAEMVSAGVVPLSQEMIRMNKQAQIEKIISGLSENDKRRLKRKFRKLWRKLRYRNGRRITHKNKLREGKPTATQMKRRKQAVFAKFYRDTLDAIKKIDPTYGT
jgi:hypothetical protein